MRLLLLLALAGCPANPPPACITVDLNCGEGYPATFDNVYANTLIPKCSMTSSCHSIDGHQANLSLGGDEASAYAALMAKSSIDPSRARVVPGNAACSLMIVPQPVGERDSAGRLHRSNSRTRRIPHS